MRATFISLTLLAALCVPASAPGEPIPIGPPGRRDDPRDYPPRRARDLSPGEQLVTSWIRKYLNRGPNETDLLYGRQIDAGDLDPLTEFARVFGCDEYYVRAGGDDGRWVGKMFSDVTGRKPSERDFHYWSRRLRLSAEGMEGRLDVARELIDRYPPALPVADPEELDYRSPRPYDRDRIPPRERDRDRNPE